MSGRVEWKDLGLIPYREALKLQFDLRSKRIEDEIPDTILLLEHPPVFTMGKRRIEGDFLMSRDEIRAKGVDVVETDRGGRVTYHGPGQLVVYFIFKLGDMGVRDFVAKLADVCRTAALEVGVDAETSLEHPGLWYKNDKLAAIGLNIERGVTMHGVAVNVDLSLEPYSYIVACGINNRGISTLSDVLGKKIRVADFKMVFLDSFSQVFSRRIFPECLPR